MGGLDLSEDWIKVRFDEIYVFRSGIGSYNQNINKEVLCPEEIRYNKIKQKIKSNY